MGNASCSSTSSFNEGTVSCNPDCTLDTSMCYACGNGSIEGPELCDGEGLADQTCLTYMDRQHGQLRCSSDCMAFDGSDCHTCGDGIIEGPEICDGTVLADETCLTQTGLQHGNLLCTGDCLSFDSSGCFTCGNGEVEGPELCDGDELGGESCLTAAGHRHGTLSCGSDCLSFDTSACHTCGDGTVEEPEICDGTNLAGQSCQSHNYEGGTLLCSGDCTFDERSCCNWGGVNPCDGVTCSNHGTCVIYDCKPFCDCDPFYHHTRDLQCVSNPGFPLSGFTCTRANECVFGFCYQWDLEEPGYCSDFNCRSDDECFNFAGDYRGFCCIPYADTVDFCFKIGAGYDCGDRTGQCGTPCIGQTETACEDALWCHRLYDEDPNAVCTNQCTTDDDCAGCEDPGDPDKVFTCQPVPGVGNYCLPPPAPACSSFMDCPEYDICYPAVTPTQLEGRCGRLGGLHTGDACVLDPDLPHEEQCASFFCLDGRCSEMCTVDMEWCIISGLATVCCLVLMQSRKFRM